jgi:carbamoylphosphate synthase large subunit
VPQVNSTSQNRGASAPRILLTDTDRRAYAARLAIGFSKAGSLVSAITTYGHPIEKTHVVHRNFRYSALRPLESLKAAIEATDPDIILPCCDRGAGHLHELHEQTRSQGESGNDIAVLIERSLGLPESYPIVSSRYNLLKVAIEEGVRVPHTRPIGTVKDLKTWQAEQALPWVLKSDGSWGGRGVRIALSPQQAEQFLSAMIRPVGIGRAVKRLCVNRDPFYLESWWDGSRPEVIVQSHIQGHPANCAVVCWEGKVLAGIGVEVVSSEGSTGPATVVRVVENPEMMVCADRITRRLGLSGFFGFDFMIESGTGQACLIEMNPRCTPVCHLQLGKGRDMVAALYAQLSSEPYVDTPPVTLNELIAYFPQEAGANLEFQHSSFQDVPQGEPELVQELLRPWPERTFLYRATNYLHRLTNGAGTPAGGQEQ